MRLSEERFGAIIRQAAVGIAETDLTGRFLLVNRRFCETVGYTKKQLLKMKMQDITLPMTCRTTSACSRSRRGRRPVF